MTACVGRHTFILCGNSSMRMQAIAVLRDLTWNGFKDSPANVSQVADGAMPALWHKSAMRDCKAPVHGHVDMVTACHPAEQAY